MLESSREHESSFVKTRPALRVAIDGPASAGKTAVGMLVAEKLDYRFFDTGLIYRALALAAIDNEVDPWDENRLYKLACKIEFAARDAKPDGVSTYRVVFDGKELNARLQEPLVSEMASKISSLGSVRRSLLELQRRVIEPGGVVAAGRDVGTVVAPDAELKIFLTASPEERAKRRFKEMPKLGRRVDYETVLSEIEERDERDTKRELSPTVPADDAIVIQTDGITAQQVVDHILEEVRIRVVE